MVSKRKLTAIAALLMLLVPFAVSANGSSDSSSTGSETVTWWHIGTAANDRAMYEGFADEFMKLHPDVTIEITVLENEAFKSKLTTVMQSGNPPDLFQTWGGGVLSEYAKAGLTRDITSFVKGTEWGDSVASGIWEVYSTDGKVYAVPNDAGGITFWYNKDILAEVGYKSFPKDWDDFLVMVKKIKEAGYIPIALGGADKWPAMHMWSYIALRLGGPELFQDTFSGDNSMGFEHPMFIKAGQMLADLAAMEPFQDGFLGATYNDEAALVGNGEAAMELMGHWAPNVQKDNSNSKEGIGDSLAAAVFPAVADGKGNANEVIGGGGGWAFGKNASDAAVEFGKFLTNKENMITVAKTNGTLVTTKGAEVGITDPNAKMVKALVDKCTFFQLYLDQFLSPAAGAAVNDAVQTILAGTASPEEACAAIQAAFANN